MTNRIKKINLNGSICDIGEVYTAGTGIDITNNVISNTQTSAEWGNITGTLSAQTDLQSALDGKVDENVAITGATKAKITYDAKGLVTAGADLVEADIPTLGQAKITNLTSDLATINDRLGSLESIGRFLSIWDSTTGLPTTNPPQEKMPYAYHTGDYFRIGAVAASGGVNYMPSGSSYTGAASTVVTTEEIAPGDIWFYDSTTWTLQVNHAGGAVSDVKLNGTSLLNQNKEAIIPIATTSSLGAVKPDGTSIVINNGVISGASQYVLPLAASGTRGGAQIGYVQSGKNYPVQLSSEKMYVNVPWTDTTYSAATSSAAGLMSATDKAKVDAVPTPATLCTFSSGSGAPSGSGVLGQIYIDTTNRRVYIYDSSTWQLMNSWR